MKQKKNSPFDWQRAFFETKSSEYRPGKLDFKVEIVTLQYAHAITSTFIQQSGLTGYDRLGHGETP
jgi:hypothetical protein